MVAHTSLVISPQFTSEIFVNENFESLKTYFDLWSTYMKYDETVFLLSAPTSIIFASF